MSLTGAPDDASRGMLVGILRANPDLLSLYLLRTAHDARVRFQPESIINFLFWFAVKGKLDHPAIARFDANYLQLLQMRFPDGRAMLDHVAAQIAVATPARSESERHELDAATRFRLGPLQPVTDAQARQSPARAAAWNSGVSIVGYPLRALGIGEDARTLFHALRSLSVNVSLHEIPHADLLPITEAEDYAPFVLDRPCFRLTIVCAPLFETARLLTHWGRAALRGHYVVGYWPWELTRLDEAWSHVFDVVDEIWASTTFLERVYRAGTTKPVVAMPLCVEIETPDEMVWSAHGLRRSETNFLAMVDLKSTLKRKNALGAIEAFRRAFPRDDASVSLTIKTTYLAEGGPDADALLVAAAQDDRVQLVDGSLSRAEICGLIAGADVFVSLHRAEGFGRVIAEAMLLRTAVIATDWSGSRDFLDHDTGFPVGFHLTPVELGDYPEAAGEWAEPDLDEAARFMRLSRSPAARARVLDRAEARIRETYSLQAVAAALSRRLVELDHQLTSAPPMPE